MGKPVAVRYPRGNAWEGLKEFRRPIEFGTSEILYEEEDIALISVGSMVKTGAAVRRRLKEMGYSCSLINARFVKPIDEKMVEEMGRGHKLLVTMEENVSSGGFGEKVREYADSINLPCKVLTIAIPDEYVEHGNVDLLYREVGIDEETVLKRVVTAYISAGAGRKG